MIKNIPNKYDQPLLLQAINKNHQDKFDFFYLPIDFKVTSPSPPISHFSRTNATLGTRSLTSVIPPT